jgi:hypothetical protein
VIRLVKASTLAALRAAAARCATLSELLDEAAGFRRAAEAARDRAREAEAAALDAKAAAEAAQARAEASYTALYQDTLAGVMRAKTAVSDPQTGHAFQAELA